MKTENGEELIEVLNDLVRINNDRIQGYEKAIEHADGASQELKSVFGSMIEESRDYKEELIDAIKEYGGEAEFEESTSSGKLYRFWMNIKERITSGSRETVLEDCEFGEDAAQKAYQEALESDATMDADVRKIIVSQKAALKRSHDTIRNLRDSEKALARAKH